MTAKKKQPSEAERLREKAKELMIEYTEGEIKNEWNATLISKTLLSLEGEI